MTAFRILTFNWHEAYLCLLAKTGHSFTVVDKFKGGYRGWLEGTRPIPTNIRLLAVGSEEEARRQARAGSFDLAICHNLSDLAVLSGVRIPKIVVFHNMLSTEIALFKAAGRPAPTKAQYAAQFRSVSDDLTRVVFISATKQADAEGIEGRVILPGIDLDEYGGYRGDVPRVLRVGNFFTGRDIMLGQTVAAASLGDLPVTVLGINPEIPGSRLSQSWDDLKEHFRSHRVFLNTTVDGYEDGYNLSMLEAMATGMPVVSLPNRTSPIDDCLNGYVSDQPSRLHDRMEALLADPLLARKLGARARDTVASKFPMDRFIREWNDTFDEIARPSNAAKQSNEAERDAREIAAFETEARDLVTRGHWSQARSLLEKKLEEYPDAAPLWKVLGFAYKNLGREPDAFRAFWAAARLDPGDDEAQKIYLLGLLSIAPGAHPENNSEAAMLACICSGKGIDVGCGPNKTHPGAIGVDLVPAGSPGTAGGVKGLLSVADICASGDDLHMFDDSELDYVVSRHNLEHYQDPLKALEEWKRVLKAGGILGLVLPDDTNIDSIRLDETHKHVFTPDSFRRLIRYLGDFDVVHIGGCLRNWSFVAVLQKQGGSVEPLNYPNALSKAAADRCRAEAQRREQSGEPAAALECWREASELEPHNPEDLRGRVRMLRRLGRLEDSEGPVAELNARFPNVSKTGAQLGSGSDVQPATLRKRILLSHCSNPITTGSYLERALRKRHDVLTWGPAIDDDVMKAWDLTSLRHRVRPTDLGFESPNVGEALKRWAPGWVPDVFLWIESGVQFPVQGLEALSCVKACYLIDTHIEFPNDRRIDVHLEWARPFDVVFLAQRAYVQRFRAAGLDAYWLPLGCDPDINKDLRMPRVHPIGFVGTLNQRRVALIGRLRSRFGVHMERCFLEEMSRVFSQSKIVFNSALNNDLNMRVFEAMASGALLLTDPAPGSGLEEFFQDGKHLAIYPSDEALVEVAGRWLSNDEAREKVAAAGQAEVLAHHTYEHRVISMEQVLFSSSAEGQSASEQKGPVDLHTEARALMTTRRDSGFGSGRGSQSASETEARLGRGRILLSAGKCNEAEGHFRRWRDEDPNASFAWLGLGCIDLARGRWEDAERNFRLALQISPDEPNALCGLGLALGNSGREMEATDALIRSLKAEPARIGTLHALVRAAVTVGRFSEALDALKSFMDHERATPELLFSCAALSARQGDAEEALVLLDRVEELEPSYPGLAACRSAWSKQMAPVAELQ